MTFEHFQSVGKMPVFIDLLKIAHNDSAIKSGVLSKVCERGTICKLKVTRKGHRKKRHIKGKGLDLGAVPPRINIC